MTQESAHGEGAGCNIVSDAMEGLLCVARDIRVEPATENDKRAAARVCV